MFIRHNHRPAFFVTAVSWNKTGSKLYTGTSKGYLNIIDVATNKVGGLNKYNDRVIKQLNRLYIQPGLAVRQ